MKLFNSLGHAFAWFFSKLVPSVEKGASILETAVTSPLATFLASTSGVMGAQVQSDIEAVAGSVISSVTTSGAAVSAAGTNISFDAAALAAIERLVSTVGGLFGKTTPAPTPTLVVSTPIASTPVASTTASTSINGTTE